MVHPAGPPSHRDTREHRRRQLGGTALILHVVDADVYETNLAHTRGQGIPLA